MVPGTARAGTFCCADGAAEEVFQGSDMVSARDGAGEGCRRRRREAHAFARRVVFSWSSTRGAGVKLVGDGGGMVNGEKGDGSQLALVLGTGVAQELDDAPGDTKRMPEAQATQKTTV